MKNIIHTKATIKIDDRDVEKIQKMDPNYIAGVIEEITEVTLNVKIKDGIRVSITFNCPTSKELFDCVTKTRG